MNNEPVAWMLNGILHEFDPSDWAKEQYPDQNVIPLYTHPVKELTDEDLEAVYQTMTGIEVNHYEYARACIRKAQEK